MGKSIISLRNGRAYRAVLICVFAVYLSAEAHAANAPVPNFAPTPNTSWFPDRRDGDDFLPPEHGGPGPVMSDPDHLYRPNGVGDFASDNPNYRIADLTNPILQPWAIEQMRLANDEVREGIIPFTARQRCYPPGVPAWNVFRRISPPMLFFVQTPEKVLIIWRGDNQTRRVYLNVPHSQNPKPSWHGESVGHYEGDTLVVDTIALLDHPLSFVDNYRTPHSDQLHVVERFRMIDENTIDINIYVEDPGAFTMPWNARQILSKSEVAPIQESICADGNPDYFNIYTVEVPQADPPDF